jgi:hypothetical protein
LFSVEVAVADAGVRAFMRLGADVAVAPGGPRPRAKELTRRGKQGAV